mgnify:FL=1
MTKRVKSLSPKLNFFIKLSKVKRKKKVFRKIVEHRMKWLASILLILSFKVKQFLDKFPWA